MQSSRLKAPSQANGNGKDTENMRDKALDVLFQSIIDIDEGETEMEMPEGTGS